MKEKFLAFLSVVLMALASLFRSRKFLLAVFAVAQTIIFTLRPDINQDIWKAIDALVAILIAAIAHEDAAAKSANPVSAAADPAAINLAGTQLGLYAAKAFMNQAMLGSPYFHLDAQQSSVVLGIDAIAQVYVSDGNGPAGGVAVVQQRDDGKGEIFLTDPSGLAEFHFGAGSAFSPPLSPPLHIFIALNPVRDEDTRIVTYKAKLSDEIWVGDTAGLHTHWRIKLRTNPVQPPPPTVDVPVLQEPLRDSVRAASWKRRGVDFNPDAALYKKALAVGLGRPETPEYLFKDSAGMQYIGQDYNMGIVYCLVGDYGNVKVVSWL